MVTHSFLEQPDPFRVHVLLDVKKAKFQICMGAWNLNKEQRFGKQQISIDDFKSICMLSFRACWQGIDGDYFTINEKSGIRNFL